MLNALGLIPIKKGTFSINLSFFLILVLFNKRIDPITQFLDEKHSIEYSITKIIDS